MRMYAARLWVDDLAAARRFYGEALGLAQLWEQPTAIGYDVGVTLIVELDGGDAGEDLVGRFAGLSLEVDDMDAAHADLTAKGVVFVSPPARMPWGGVLAHFKDPAGNVLTLLGGSD